MVPRGQPETLRDPHDIWRVLVAVGVPDTQDLWVHMCGPPAMMSALANGFQQLGIPADRIRWEQFNTR